jgi:nucleotide-binding universal stress UspA family protein
VPTKLDAQLSVITTAGLRDAEMPLLRSQLKELEAKLQPTGRLRVAKMYFGDSADMILRAADELDADLIVMGSHASHGFNRIGMGSTAEHVLREALVPLLFVKRAARPSLHGG